MPEKKTRQVRRKPSTAKRRAALAALRKSLLAKPATGYRVGVITEDDKYGDDPVILTASHNPSS